MKTQIIKRMALCLLLLLVFCGCSGKAADVSLYDQGLALIDLMAEAARTEGYLGIYTANTAMHDIVSDVGTGDYTAPIAVYAITFSEEALSAMAELDSMDGASAELRRIVRQRVLAAIPSQINAAGGAEVLAASTICTLGTTFVSAEPMQDCIYLYAYADAAPAAITFIAGQDGAVSATGVFLLTDFPADSAAAIEAYFTEIPVTVTEIDG